MISYSFPGTANQERFLLSQITTGVSPLLPVSYDIRGPLNSDRLVKALTQLIQDQDMLRARATFSQTEGCQIDVYATGHPVIFTQYDHLPVAERAEVHRADLKLLLDDHDSMFRAHLAVVDANHHILTVVPHHALIDGLSINAIIHNISEFYNTGSTPQASQNEYQDTYAALYEAEQNSISLKYWSDYLDGLPDPSSIAAAHRKINAETDQTACIRLPISQQQHTLVLKAAKAAGVRTFSAYLDIALLVLERLTGDPDVPIAIQSAGRQSQDISPNVIGMFSKALVVRSPKPRTTLINSFDKTNKAVTEALQHEDIPYHHVIRETGIAPRFAVNWFPPHSGLTLTDCSAQEVIVTPWPTTFDVNLHIVKTVDELELRIFYNLSAVDHETATHLGTMFNALLNQLSLGLEKNPARLVSPGPDHIGQAASAREPQKTLDQVVLASAAAHPEAEAIRSDGLSLSYSALSAHIADLANTLPQRGRVAIIAHRGAGLAIGALATSHAGGSFVLIDPCYPSERIQAMLEQIDPDAVILGTPLLSTPPDILGGTPQPLHVPGLAHMIRRAPKHAQPRADETLPAYFLFTSGSTGAPKVIATDHAPLTHALKWQSDTFGIDQAACVSFLSGVGHDPALRDIFLPLSLGGTLVAPDPSRIFEPGYLARWLKDEHVTHAHLTPSMVQLIATGGEGIVCQNLQHIFIGGEPVGGQTLDQVLAIAPNADVTNVYGASETPQIVVYNQLNKGDTPWPDNIPVGQPRPDVSIQIKDREGRSCGPYEPGEICISTPYLSNGYMDPALTDAAFAGLSDTRHQSVYRTGDMGYFTLDHKLVLLGRADNQIKLNGYRIELDEVEGALRKAVAPNWAAVSARPLHENEDQRLVGFVTQKDTSNDEADILHELRAVLPAYMVPDRIVILEALPLLATGKIDRRALKTMELPRAEAVEYTPPATNAEQDLVAVWEDILNISPISVTDNMFNLGADSLTAVRLILEMERKGIDTTTAKAIMRGASIREIAAHDPSTDHDITSREIPAGPLLSRTSIHVLRGLLVILLVTGHWMPGIMARIPGLSDLSPLLTPIFQMATPGFAILFGVSLGYFMYATYLKRPDILRQQVRMGIGIIAFAMLLLAALKIAQHLIEEGTLDHHVVAMSFYNVLGFYLLAMISVPLWFTVLKRSPQPILATCGLILIYICLDQFLRYLFVPYEPKGFVQLARLYSVAKFSYFNMSIGALIGLGLGLAIHQNETLPLQRRVAVLCVLLILVGLAWGGAYGELPELIGRASRIDYWKLLIYLGAIGLLAHWAWRWLLDRDLQTSWFGSAINIVGAIGVLALPFYVFHGVVLDVKGLLDALGVPDVIGIALVLSVFFGAAVWAIKKVRKVY